MTPKRIRAKSGVVIITVLWVLVVLSFLALSLGQGARIDFLLAKNFVGKVKSRYAAWGGVEYAIQQIHDDSLDEESSKFDSLAWCGVRPNSERSPQDMFQNHALGDGYFDISYLRETDDAEDQVRLYGLRDEERRINLNTLTKNNFGILSTLLMELGVDEEQALTVTHAIIDWKDPDDILNDQEYGAEREYYEALDPPYLPKNMPYESVEELLLVRGVTPEIYNKLKSHVTLYPIGGELRINFETATERMLRSVAIAVSGSSSGTDENDARALVEKMVKYRAGQDRVENTEDDRIIEVNELVLNRRERALFIRMSNLHRARKSNFLRVEVTGFDGTRKIPTKIEAVIGRDNLNIVYWKRN